MIIAGKLPRKPLKQFGIRPKTGRKRRKKGEITKLKDKLWALCRQIQIQKYGNKCFTCGRGNLVGSNLQLGHGITSALCSVAIRFDLRHLRIQDYYCNINLSGNWPSFRRNLIAEGIDVDALLEENEATKGLIYTKEWFEAKITEYTKLLQEQ